ncbi:MAG: sensor histidine kinase [Nitrospinota bacterium]
MLFFLTRGQEEKGRGDQRFGDPQIPNRPKRNTRLESAGEADETRPRARRARVKAGERGVSILSIESLNPKGPLPPGPPEGSDLPEIPKRILSEALRLLGAEGGAVFLDDRKRDTLGIGASFALSQKCLDAVSETCKDPLVGRSLRDPESILARGAGADPRFRTLRTAIEAEGYRSFLLAPLISGDTSLGILLVCFKGTRELSAGETAAVRAFSALSALALEAGRVHERRMQASRRLRAELEEQAKRHGERIRELERRWAESEKLAATSRLAAAFAHEINNPLAGVKNALQLIKEAVPRDHPHRHYLGRIEKEIDRMAEIVRQMYVLYRPEEETEGETDVAALLRHVVALLEPGGREREVGIALEIQDFPVTASLSESLLARVAFNLLQNAIEASPRGGTVEVSAALSGDRVRISISDRGPGIPADMRSRIFEPFFTTKGKEPAGGLGLGLSISQSLAAAMGGSIDFVSRPGEGTTFRVDLPREKRRRNG